MENRYVRMSSLFMLVVFVKSSFLCVLVCSAIFPLFFKIFIATVMEKVVSAQLFDSVIV